MQVIVLVKSCLEMMDVLLISVIMHFFKEKQIIKPEELVSRENDVSTLIGKEALPMETKRYRDIVRKASINGEYMIIGVEHQSTLDKNMIIRILNYDAQLYINQVESGKKYDQ